MSCCDKCNKNKDCEYWVRDTKTKQCWLKSNDGNAIIEFTSSTLRGGHRAKGTLKPTAFDRSQCPSLKKVQVQVNGNVKFHGISTKCQDIKAFSDYGHVQ